jgi:hypothetical protein
MSRSEQDSRIKEIDELSIVVQGGVFASNIEEVAVHCQHWRALFPKSEVILSVSTSDCLVFQSDVHGGERPDLGKQYAQNHQLRTAVRVLLATCDKVALADGALPLPPIKSFIKSANNGNFQIAAAKRGLNLASRKYVLRIRGDVVFADKSFVDQYLEGESLTRGPTAVLRSRVLISWLFTLNPYSHERMPLHFSDWFHFGLTEDVRQLWDVPPMSYADSVYFRTNLAAPHSNYQERAITTRLAVEQHIMYHAFKPHFPDLILKYYNDLTSVELANDILIDNFNVCDIIKAKMIFPKYEEAFYHDVNNSICVSRTKWFGMCSTTSQPRDHFINQTLAQYLEDPIQDFPIEIGTNRLSTKIGTRGRGFIACSSASGVAIHGPYLNLPRGRYRAVLHVALLQGPGTLQVKITADEGIDTLSNFFIDAPDISSSDIVISFDLADPLAKKVEIVCETANLREFTVTGLTIEKREASYSTPPTRTFRASSDALATKVGRRSTSGLATTGTKGTLCYGPYIKLPEGNYVVSWQLKDVSNLRGTTFQVVCSEGKRILKEIRGSRCREVDGPFNLDVNLGSPEKDVEFRVQVDRSAAFELSEISVHAC